MTQHFDIDAAIALSPGNKAITELLSDQVCIIHCTIFESSADYLVSVVDLAQGEETQFDRVHKAELDDTFDEYKLITSQGIFVSITARTWLPLEWWQPSEQFR